MLYSAKWQVIDPDSIETLSLYTTSLDLRRVFEMCKINLSNLRKMPPHRPQHLPRHTNTLCIRSKLLEDKRKQIVIVRTQWERYTKRNTYFRYSPSLTSRQINSVCRKVTSKIAVFLLSLVESLIQLVHVLHVHRTKIDTFLFFVLLYFFFAEKSRLPTNKCYCFH